MTKKTQRLQVLATRFHLKNTYHVVSVKTNLGFRIIRPSLSYSLFRRVGFLADFLAGKLVRHKTF